MTTCDNRRDSPADRAEGSKRTLPLSYNARCLSPSLLLSPALACQCRRSPEALSTHRNLVL